MSSVHHGDVEPRIARLEQQEQRLVEALELLAQRAATPAGRPRRDWDALAAVIASFIGFLALAVSGYTAYVQRQQLRAQVWPHLRIASSDTGPSMGWEVVNQGTGPARVTAMRVMVDGAPVTTWSDVWKAAGYRGEGTIISTISQAVIPPGKEIVFVRPTEQQQSRAKFEDLLPNGKHRLAIALCYCSVLDECWIAISGDRMLDGRPTTIDGCPITVDERFVE